MSSNNRTSSAVAITGGSGFIGGFLTSALEDEGCRVRIVDIVPPRQGAADFHRADVRDRSALVVAFRDCDTVFHLAAVHRDDVRPAALYADVNVGGAESLVAAAEEHRVTRIVFTSTVAVYGLDAGSSREEDAPRPFNEYGRTKLAAEQILRRWAERDPNRILVIVRLVATFGPGNRGNIHTLIERISNRKFTMVGDGSNRKSLAYVRNVAAFLAFCRGFGPGTHLVNYADKPDLSTAALVETIRRSLRLPSGGRQIPRVVGIFGGFLFDAAARVSGRSFAVSAVRVRKFCADTVVDASRAHGSGFAPPYSLVEGLEETIRTEFAVEGKAA
jgi:nucleoside-diphosphate-sugar epimerase